MWFWFFVISFLINVLLLFYARWLIKTISVINEDVENLTEMMIDFTTHTKSIYELEIYYGDDTLQSLLEHAKMLTERLQDLDLVLNVDDDEEKGEELEISKEET